MTSHATVTGNRPPPTSLIDTEQKLEFGQGDWFMTMPIKMLLVLVGITAANAGGQTCIDLQRQTTNVDFTKAAVTQPVKTGHSLPSICSVGDLYFYTPGQQAQIFMRAPQLTPGRSRTGEPCFLP